MSTTTSPVKLPHRIYATNEVENPIISSEDVEEIALDQFWEELHYNSKSFKSNQKISGGDVRDFKKYMDKISRQIHKAMHLSPERLILFYNASKNSPTDHPTGIQCKPGLSACSFQVKRTEKEIHWTGIDATVEIPSAGTSATEGLRQAIYHTLLLLQARPDRVSVQGMYADDKCVILVISTAAGIKMSPTLHLTKTSHIRLLHAFVKRLYDPHSSMIDPTIKRRKDGPQWVFDIAIPNVPKFPSPVECRGYRILSAPGSLGQRTHIFVNEEHPALFNGVPIPIIKDQYSQVTNYFDEAEVISHIHAERKVPGVISLVYSGVVQRGDGSTVSSGNCHKTRMGLQERGTPFMDIKTPLEVLKVIYDLLEVTRLLYTKRQVLHRDISIGNVLHLDRDRAAMALPLVDTNPASGTSCNKFCSVNYLLDSNLGYSYNSTSTLLIDFNRGALKDDKACSQQMGTPVFMARAVRLGQPLGRVGDLVVYSRMPKLSEKAHTAYEKVFPDRLIRFQDSTDRYLKEITGDYNKSWQHELRHEAESIFRLLAWWALHALPEGGSSQSKIPASIWSLFTDPKCNSSTYCDFTHSLHQTYSPLEDLLDDLGDALRPDFHWATEDPYTDPEFLHEVLQRHILNFIFSNQNEDFMNKPKTDALRQPKTVDMNRYYEMRLLQGRRRLDLKRSRDLDPQAVSGSNRKKFKAG